MRRSILLLVSLLAISSFLLSYGWKEEPVPPMGSEDDMEFMGPMGDGPMGPVPFGGFERFGRWWKNSRFVKELNLTDEQIGKIDKIFTDTEKKLIDLRAACRKAELELRGLEGKEAESLKKIDEIYKLKAEIHKSIFLMTNQIKKELTPEQLKKLEEIKSTIAQERMRHFREKGFERRKQ
jgi:Spy/CpxP family protein refolding chaperone